MLPHAIPTIAVSVAAPEPILDVDFDALPPGTVRAARGALPHRWVINSRKKD